MKAIPGKTLDPRFPRKPGKIPRKGLNLGWEILRTAQKVLQVLDPEIPIKSEKMPRKAAGPETVEKVSVQEFLERSHIQEYLQSPGKLEKISIN